MRILHFSDPHAGGAAEDFLAYFDKRWVGVFNFAFRRRFQHDLSLLKDAVDYILGANADMVVCTGDLTSTGQPGEFEATLKIIKAIGEAGIPLIYVPGNHDYYVYRNKCVTAMRGALEYLNAGRFTFESLPCCFDFGDCRFIVVNESFPSNLISSGGYLRREDSLFVERECEKPKDRPRIIIGHYPLHEDKPLRRIRHRLWGQRNVLQLLEDGKIDLSLCGHVHIPQACLDSRGRGEIIAGSVTRNRCLAKIEYDKDKDVFSYEKVLLR